MVITGQLMDNLLKQAAASPRLRQNFDLRNSPDDTSQRMLNALMPGTELPIHRHRTTSETVVLLRGRLLEIFYDDSGSETGRTVLEEDGIRMLDIPAGQWHTSVALAPSVIFEAKDGRYEPRTAQDVMERG